LSRKERFGFRKRLGGFKGVRRDPIRSMGSKGTEPAIKLKTEGGSGKKILYWILVVRERENSTLTGKHAPRLCQGTERQKDSAKKRWGTSAGKKNQSQRLKD